MTKPLSKSLFRPISEGMKTNLAKTNIGFSRLAGPRIQNFELIPTLWSEAVWRSSGEAREGVGKSLSGPLHIHGHTLYDDHACPPVSSSIPVLVSAPN